MRGQGSPCIALPGHGICVGRRTTLLQLQQATQGPRSLQILSSICLLCHSFTVHGCARYTFVHVCHDNFLFGSPPKLSGLVNEAVAAGSHIVRTAPADESRPNVHRLLCRSQTGEPKTVPSLCVSTTLLRDNKASSQKKQLQSTVAICWPCKATSRGCCGLSRRKEVGDTCKNGGYHTQRLGKIN